MAEKDLDNGSHIARYCPRNRLIRNGDHVIGVHARLYALRENEEYLSMSHWEFFPGSDQERATAAADAVPLTVTKHDYIVRLNVGTVKAIGKKHSHPVRALHTDKNAKNPAYVKVRGTPKDSSHVMLNDLADTTVSVLFKP